MKFHQFYFELFHQFYFTLFKKQYIAICDGIFENKTGSINLPIARKQNSIIERCISKNGQMAITHYKVLKEFNDYSLVLCDIETGRTHQIRVHMSAIGHCILGDDLYGKNTNLISRQALHSYKILFEHPILKQKIEFKAPIPNDFKLLLK